MASISRVSVALFFLCLTACTPSERNNPQRFVTEYGLGPDKWATAWLLTRHVDTNGSLVVVEQGASLPAGIAFDTPVSELRRIEHRTAFEVTRDTYGIGNPVVQDLVGIVHDIEVNFWGADKTREAQVVESAFRDLQKRYGRDRVPAECYLTFFDRVSSALAQSQAAGAPIQQGGLTVTCDRDAQSTLVSAAAAVREMPIAELLGEMQRGKNVVFVDVREAAEFAEAHIPHALNIPLRELDDQAIAQLQAADYVVSYCVKDFRGFEMAKALAQAGIQRSVILKPYGIKGWVAQGLPTVGSRALSQEQALRQFDRCISQGQCSGFGT
ncbi:chromate resistance protein ChrB domain-containing protein [Microbulbifer sp. 2304DJ12-6]|uniref:chromate resistance protein ChrB domain-containing protein n=1 Tax=Microbulbifer sp. 2304DJ12-6 TaxID=3233340 RepID=UPI0039B1126C